MKRLTREFNRRISAVLILLMVLSLSGCGIISRETGGSVDADTVFTFAGEEIGLGEVYLYAYAVKEDYEKVYGKGIWDMDISVSRDESANMEDVTRKDIIENIVHVKLLNAKASEYKCALTDEESNAADREADKFYGNLTDQQIKDMQLDYEMVHKVMQENALAKKVHDVIIADAGIEISDEAARETTFYDMYFECYAVASNGDVTKFSEDEKSAQYERAVEAYNTLVSPVSSANGDNNIEALAEYYGLQNCQYYTLTPSEIAGIYGNDIKEDIYLLEDGSYSLVTESEFGYHIFYMVALTDREATDQHKSEMIVSKENAYMDTIYEDWLPGIDPDYSYETSVDFDTYERIAF